MYDFGIIVLVPFPFTDLSSAKVRPALIVSQKNEKNDDVVVCFITSQEGKSKKRKRMMLENNLKTGLKVPSVVRFDKIATLEKRVVLGELGRVDKKLLEKHRAQFFEVFGFKRK